MKYKNFKKKILSDAFLIRLTIISVTFAIIIVVCHFYYFRIYTKCWHLIHSDQIEWNGLNIVIPKKLISLTSFDDDDNEKIRILYYKNAYQISIYFSTCYHHLNSIFNYTYVDRFKKIGLNVVKEETLNIQGYSCMKIISEGTVSGRRIYREDIFFKTKPWHIDFTGDEKKKHYLQKILNNLSIAEN